MFGSSKLEAFFDEVEFVRKEASVLPSGRKGTMAVPPKEPKGNQVRRLRCEWAS